MIIYYDTLEEMIEIVSGLVRQGLTFQVQTNKQTIELTGGY